jgi:hypothetical protein
MPCNVAFQAKLRALDLRGALRRSRPQRERALTHEEIHALSGSGVTRPIKNRLHLIVLEIQGTRGKARIHLHALVQPVENARLWQTIFNLWRGGRAVETGGLEKLNRRFAI